MKEERMKKVEEGRDKVREERSKEGGWKKQGQKK